MSHLRSQTVPTHDDNPPHDLNLNMSKAVISLWFLVPLETAMNVLAEDDGKGSVFPRTIPLVTWGDQLVGELFTWGETVVGTQETINHLGDPVTVDEIGVGPTGTVALPYPPSHIGVRVMEGGTDGPVGALQVHIQTTSLPTSENTSQAGIGYVPIDGEGRPGYLLFEDASYTDDVLYQYFGNSGFNDSVTSPYTSIARSSDPPSLVGGFGQNISTYSGAPEITFGEWHHVLLSWDIGSSNSSHGTTDISDDGPFVSTTDSVMWFALDDEDFSFVDQSGPNFGDNFPAMSASGFDHNALKLITGNKMVSQSVQSFAGAVRSVDYTDVGGIGPISTVSVGFDSLPSGPIGLPAAASSYQDYYAPVPGEAGTVRTISPIRGVAMGECQLYVGVTLDTSVEANRRAFVTAQGRPANVSAVPEPGSPEYLAAEKALGKPPEVKWHFQAETLLGKPPEVGLHGSGRWKAGKNIGTAGDFGPTGTITRFKPDPEIDPS